MSNSYYNHPFDYSNKINKTKKKKIMEIVCLIVGLGVGFAAGLYIATQIERRIDKNIKK